MSDSIVALREQVEALNPHGYVPDEFMRGFYTARDRVLALLDAAIAQQQQQPIDLNADCSCGHMGHEHEVRTYDGGVGECCRRGCNCKTFTAALAQPQAAAGGDDAERLDVLEAEARAPGGLLLHDGSEKGRRGLGLLGKSLRERIDQAFPPATPPAAPVSNEAPDRVPPGRLKQDRPAHVPAAPDGAAKGWRGIRPPTPEQLAQMHTDPPPAQPAATADTLRADTEEWQRAAIAEQEAGRLRVEWGVAVDQGAASEAEAALLREDKARLDWLERNATRISASFTLPAWRTPHYGESLFWHHEEEVPPHATKLTIRETVDAMNGHGVNDDEEWAREEPGSVGPTHEERES